MKCINSLVIYAFSICRVQSGIFYCKKVPRTHSNAICILHSVQLAIANYDIECEVTHANKNETQHKIPKELDFQLWLGWKRNWLYFVPSKTSRPKKTMKKNSNGSLQSNRTCNNITWLQRKNATKNLSNPPCKYFNPCAKMAWEHPN